MKFVLIVIDSFGIGEMPDANSFGDIGSNTYLNILNKCNLSLPNMEKLGLKNIDGINLSSGKTIGNFARLQEKTFAKDTTAGHYEICGVVMKNPYPTFPNGFPNELLNKIKKETGVEFLGNKVASGTEIINTLGKEHLKSRKPILYTSADSVLQIASHTDVYSVEELYNLCEKIRKICNIPFNVGRIIARPFATNENGEFYRLDSRKDYALSCPNENLLDKLSKNNFDTICIGKIEDIFNYRGISESYHSRNNKDGLEEIIKHTKRRDINGLIFANLNDTDMLYGHRNDYIGYANALKEIDNAIPEIIENLDNDDILLITADHGCDPTTPSTDHSREYVPLLIYGKNLKNNVNLGTLNGLDNINNAILKTFNIENKESFIEKIK